MSHHSQSEALGALRRQPVLKQVWKHPHGQWHKHIRQELLRRHVRTCQAFLGNVGTRHFEILQESILAGDGRFNWDIASLNDPFAVCCLMFTIAMVFAGRIQDKLSPRITAVIGGVLTGMGLIVISQTTALFFWILGFGVLTGLGLGFGYASATPPAIKWFPASKTGLIAGLVVAGFGLASVYIAPLANFLMAQYGISQAMLIFGVAFLIVVCGLAMLLSWCRPFR